MKTQKFSPKRLYEQVFEQLKDEIRKGVYQKGDMLPSESELIKTMGSAALRCARPLQCLAEAGIIETRPGEGQRCCGGLEEHIGGNRTEGDHKGLSGGFCDGFQCQTAG